MATFLAVALGALLILVVLVDVFRTVLWSGQGAGPITSLVTTIGKRMLPGLPGGRRTRSAVGPLAILVVASTWALLLLVGFTLLLEGDPEAIRTSSAGLPIDRAERAYYVGYTLFTLGNGGLAPVTDAGRALTVAISATGLFLITLSVTYLLPVIAASVASRSFAAGAQSLGEDAPDVIVGAWDGERVRLEHDLRALATQLSLLAQQQLAYPVLHLFHTAERSTSAPIAVGQLDDVLTLLDAVDPGVAPLATTRRQLRSAIDAYVRTQGRAVDASPPPPPSSDRLGAAGIPLVEPATYADALSGLADHRAAVHGLVTAAGLAG